MDLFAKTASFERFAGARALCLGLGGGADAVSAALMARALGRARAAEVHYGNTKREHSSDLEPVSPHLAASRGAPVPVVGGARHGSTAIERSLPRGPGGSPLVLALPKRVEPEEFTAIGGEFASRGYDALVGVDTGGDVVKRKGRRGSRDWQALQALAAAGREPTLIILGLCSDGVAPRTIERGLAAIPDEDYLGCFPLAPWRDELERLSSGLRPTRSVRIILSALESTEDTIEVPRGGFPRVPRRWLVHGFVFRARSLVTVSGR